MDLNLPLVSIALICYNQEDTIESALKSLVDQTYKNVELIISDDCSRDSTVAIIQKFLSNLNFKYKLNVNKRNLGIGGNLAKAVSLCSGEFIVPAAGDDISTNDRVEVVVNHWLDSGKKVGYINTDLIEIDREGNYLKYKKSDNFLDYPNLEAWVKTPQFRMGTEHWSREFYEKLPPFSNVTCEDQILAFRAIMLGLGSTIHKATLKHRVGGVTTNNIRTAQEKVAKLLEDAKSSKNDLYQMLLDVDYLSQGEMIKDFLHKKIAENELIILSLEGSSRSEILSRLLVSKNVKIGKRIRLFFYAITPSIMNLIFMTRQFFKR